MANHIASWREANFIILRISFVSEYLIMPRYIGKAKTQNRNTPAFINTEGINFIILGRSNKKCRIRKNAKMKEKVIRVKSQQKIIQRGANLFVKCVFIILNWNCYSYVYCIVRIIYKEPLTHTNKSISSIPFIQII